MDDDVMTMRDTIESHTGDLCPVPLSLLEDIRILIGSDISPTSVEEAFSEMLGDLPDSFDDQLFDDLSSSLMESCAGRPL